MAKLKSLLQRGASVLAPAIHRAGGSRALESASIWLAFLEGQGAGAGWDMDNEIRSAASFITAPQPVVIDVGANRGEWSLGLSTQLQNPDARFFLFEVAPYCFPEIESRESQISNCSLVRKAVSDSNGSATLHVPTSFSGLASLHARRDVGVRQREYTELTVETVRLDDFAEEAGLDQIALIKFDIEGHELHALHGAERLLAERRVSALTFEFGSANVNSRTYFRDFWDYLTGHGYALHRMIPGGGTTPVKRYSEKLEYFRGATNYIATCQTH
jgi:FkbM family methyltransferase